MISFVYFDLGGVVELDFSETNKWEQLKKELGILPDEFDEFDSFFDRYEKEVCLGRDVETLLPLLQEKFKVKLDKKYSFLVDGFVKRFEKNPSIWPVIEKIKNSCKVGLLTNMYPNMFMELKKRGIIPSISWDVAVDSSIVGLKKPDPAIFEFAERKAGVNGSQILFVENSKSHIKAAEDFGWQTFLYDPTNPAQSSNKLLQFFLTAVKK